MADQRLVDYIKETNEKGYNQNTVKEAILHSGYSLKAYNEALATYQNPKKPKELIKSFDIPLLPAKKITILVYTIISCTLGYFSTVFIGLGLSNNTIMNYIVLFALTSGWAYFSNLMIVKIVNNKLVDLGYIIQLGVLIDLLINNRIEHKFFSLLFVIFFFSSTYFISKSSINSSQSV